MLQISISNDSDQRCTKIATIDEFRYLKRLRLGARIAEGFETKLKVGARKWPFPQVRLKTVKSYLFRWPRWNMIERLITVECHLPLVDWTIRKSVKVEAKVDALMRTDCDGFIQEGVGGRRDAPRASATAVIFFSFCRLSTHAHAHSRRVAYRFIRINWNILSILIGRDHRFRRVASRCVVSHLREKQIRAFQLAMAWRLVWSDDYRNETRGNSYYFFYPLFVF